MNVKNREAHADVPTCHVQPRDSRIRFRGLATILGLFTLLGFASSAWAGGGVLKTGQTQCWNSSGTLIACAGTGQDGELQRGVARSYTDNGDGTITDNATGLMWEKLDHFDFAANPGNIHDADNTYNPWSLAFQKVADLNAANFAGYNDWRLPNLKELQSLIFFGRSAPAVTSAFNNGTDSFTRSTGTYWSSSTNLSVPGQAWALSFTTGTTSVLFKTSAATSFCCFVRAVRGPVTLSAAAGVLKTGQTQCWNSSGTLIACSGTGQDGELQVGVSISYKDNADGTITDKATGLMWEKLGNLDDTTNVNDPHDADNNYSSWDLAFQKIAALNAANFAGHNDWRLPNVMELESLLDFGTWGPAIDGAFNNGTDSFTRSSGYWSSTTSLSLPSWANGVSFLQGTTFPTLFKTNPFGNGRVRAVRGPSATLVIHVLPVGSGTTTPAPGTYEEPRDSLVSLQATANLGYHFVNWTGGVADPNNPSTTVTMDQDRTITANFALRDFSLSPLIPIVISVGGSASSTVTVSSLGDFSQAVDLSVSGQPGGVTASLNPPSITPAAGESANSTLSVVVAPSVTPQTFTLTVTGTSGALTHSAQASLTVQATAAAIVDVINQYLALGCIDNSGIGQSLIVKLNTYQLLTGRGQIQAAANALTAFQYEVQAQAGRHVSTACAQALITDSEFLRATLRAQAKPDPILGSVVNAGDRAISGATVNLQSSSNTVIATTTTDAVGFYHFAETGGLTAGANYTVTVTLPQGYKTSAPASQSFTWSANPVKLTNFVLN